jgi:integrase
MGTPARNSLRAASCALRGAAGAEAARPVTRSRTKRRHDLECLKSAINHHRKEGLHDRIVEVPLPPKNPPRERWLTRSEAARLIWECYRGSQTKHIARFILVALYTGRRSAVVRNASFQREPGRPFIDLAAGMLLPAEGAKVTKKRNPPIPLPSRLLAHLRRWRRLGARHAVEWRGQPLDKNRLGQSLKAIAIRIGLGDKVTPHTLRHTAATWHMQAGTNPFFAGKYLGMTTRTLESTYAHHMPEHLRNVADAFQNRHSFGTDTGGQTEYKNRTGKTKKP